MADLCQKPAKVLVHALQISISMHILPTVFHTLPQVLTRRICLTINARASLMGDHFLYSRDPNK